MKDEEMAEESFKKYRTTDEDYEDLNGSEKMLVFNHEYGAEKQYRRLYKQGFLAGLKAGRPQWHNLEKDPTDLPNNRRNVWITYINGYSQRETTEASFRYKHWVISGHRTECEVIAWCEIPTFDKEE